MNYRDWLFRYCCSISFICNHNERIKSSVTAILTVYDVNNTTPFSLSIYSEAK